VADIYSRSETKLNPRRETMTDKEELAALREENARLKAGKPISFKVGDKGGLTMYGLGSRFPVTLYVEQWEKLLENADLIRSALKENAARLKRKD
jgi:hypothetical protein